MERTNRIRKFLKASVKKSQCIVVSCREDNRVILSYKGNKLVWEWKDDGLYCPGANNALSINPLAVEALVTEELNALFRIEGLDKQEISFINEEGKEIPGVILIPSSLDDNDLNVILKIEMIKGLLKAYLKKGDVITEEMIHIAIGNEVLGPFLSIINSYS